MTAKLWTTNGSDRWKGSKREGFDFTNLETKDVVTCDCVSEIVGKKFTPVTMPEIKKSKKPAEKSKVAKSSKTGKKSKYKGVTGSNTPGKYRVHFYDRVTRKVIGLGTFNNELLAAAAYQERAGEYQEAKKLRNEYQEGDPAPTE